MDREVCHVYSYFNLDLVNTVTSDLVYHDSVDEHIRLLNKRFGGITVSYTHLRAHET